MARSRQVVASHPASVEADIAVALMHARELAGIPERARAIVWLMEASGQWACLIYVLGAQSTCTWDILWRLPRKSSTPWAMAWATSS
ncbi:hypothetical protein [Archangium sp.]|uniref:hypothetical protein n=1 Tax=Archangium sp. TaxID=1872627 RepID=UPI002D490E07|nr:hypothetical protein [Archangium sp.]HYO53990.1 hypothetical protein [Archangium sp.]